MLIATGKAIEIKTRNQAHALGGEARAQRHREPRECATGLSPRLLEVCSCFGGVIFSEIGGMRHAEIQLYQELEVLEV